MPAGDKEDLYTWMLARVHEAMHDAHEGDDPDVRYERLIKEVGDYIEREANAPDLRVYGDDDRQYMPTIEAWRSGISIDVAVPTLQEEMPEFEHSLSEWGLGMFVELGDRFIVDPYTTIKRGENKEYDDAIDAQINHTLRGCGMDPIKDDAYNKIKITGTLVQEDVDSCPGVHIDGLKQESLVYVPRNLLRPILPWEDPKHPQYTKGQGIRAIWDTIVVPHLKEEGVSHPVYSEEDMRCEMVRALVRYKNFGERLIPPDDTTEGNNDE